MSKNLKNRILIVLGVIALSSFFAFPLDKKINLGLDLKGGMHLVLRVETDKLPENAKSDAVLRAIEILRNRIDSMGVGETLIQRQGENEILVQLPGVTDRETALNIIGKVAQLEFRLVNDDPDKLKSAFEGKPPPGYALKYVKKDNTPVLVENKVALSGETIEDARVDFNEQSFGLPYISLKLNDKGSKSFGELTTKNVDRKLAIILDGEVLSAPTINEAILGGNAQISGQFTYQEASILALALRSGALPAPMHVEEERTIGPLLGKDSIDAGVRAITIGLIFVFSFMGIYYLTSGMVANVALALNLLILLGVLGSMNVLLPEAKLTLTLPGIAGILLTLGMAVDANVLINERIREELRIGRPLAAAIAQGYTRALSAIIDSNVTTLIASFMLFQFGSGPVKGFAVTLALGLIASLFTSIYVTRTIFNFFVEFKLIKNLPMLSFFGKTKIDFISPRYICIILSLILIVVCMANMAQKKESAYGIDFVGGQIQEYKFTRPIDTETLRQALKKNGVDDAVIQRFEKLPEHVMIRTQEETYNAVVKTLKENFPDNTFEVLRIEKVGPVVGKALRKAAIMAIIFALGAILIYVGFRFKHFDFATAGVIALLHDVIVSLGVLVLMGRQIDLLVVTALLTIAGYSINDTIVIYDRIRENMFKMKNKNLGEIINISLNETLSRTILTTSVTFLVVLSLFLYGGEVLNSFALCLMIGFISGTYSTVFIASPLVLAWQKKK